MYRLSEDQVLRRLHLDAVFLCMLATWTLVIKFLNPILMTWAEVERTGEGSGPYILWDFWWVPHLLLALWLWKRLTMVWEFGMVVSVVEILIILKKFYVFLQAPLAPRYGAPPVFDTFLAFHWFLNKVMVLFFFILLLSQLLRVEFKAVLKKSSR